MKSGILCGIAATALWGFSNVLTKHLLAHFQRLTLLLIQLLASNALLWLMLSRERKSHLSIKVGFKISLPGLLQPGAAYIFGMFGLDLTTANSDALLWACESIIVVLLASILLRERLGWQPFVLAILGTVGTLVATGANLSLHGQATSLAGNALILAGVTCAALYTICTQNQLVDIDPLRLISLHQLSGFVFVFVVWLIFLLANSWAATHSFVTDGVAIGLWVNGNFLDLLIALLSGTTQYALSFWLFLHAMNELGATRSSILLVLPPLFTICGSFFFLQEQLTTWQWLGIVVALLAVSAICSLKTKTDGEAFGVGCQKEALLRESGKRP
jgi:drug/metabolite transporter (DMT)-like permease